MKKIQFKINYIGAFIILLCAYLLMGHEIQIREGKKILLLLILISLLFQYVVIKWGSRYRSILGQLAAVSVIPLLFFVNLRVFRPNEMSYYSKNMHTIYFVLIITGTFLMEYFLLRVQGLNWNKCKNYCVTYRYLFLVLLLIAITRIPYMNSLIIWDSGEYYYRFTDMIRFVDFSSFHNFSEYYTLCGHSTIAFSFIYLIGEFVFPKQIIGVSLVSLAMTLVAFWCLYHIIMKMFRQISALGAALATLLISMGQ